MPRKLLIGLLALGLMLPCAHAQTPPTVQQTRTQIGENYVAYPQLTGMADETLQARINDDIVLTSGVTNHLVTLATLGNSPWGLQVDATVTLQNEAIFSACLSAKGKMPNGREGQAYTALTYDLQTGRHITLSDLFADVNAAVQWMEADAEESLTEELSGYMEYSAVTPLPQSNFTLDADGITFWYPSDQLFLLSGYAGACRFTYAELLPFLKTDGLPGLAGLIPKQLTAAQAKEAIVENAEAGKLPHVPVALGDNMTELVDAYRLVRTPDAFPGGRYFVMEHPAFREVLLISDAVQSGWEGSVLEGIQLRRGELFGLVIGSSTRNAWQQLLGTPAETLAFTPNMAYDYGLPVGESDIYHFGRYELRLHADEEGTLRAIQLSK